MSEHERITQRIVQPIEGLDTTRWPLERWPTVAAVLRSMAIDDALGHTPDDGETIVRIHDPAPDTARSADSGRSSVTTRNLVRSRRYP